MADSLLETRVAERVLVFTLGGDRLESSYGANCVAIAGRDSVLLVDPLIAPAHARLVALPRLRTLGNRAAVDRVVARKEERLKLGRHLLVAILLGVASSLFAHPPVALVMDRAGNVFYSDLEKVWMISPAGKKSVAVPNVHTHELGLDGAGNLYGEHLWYEGDATKQWGYRVWRRTPQGRVSDVIPARRGFPSGYGFPRDAAEATYWADRGKPARFFKKTASGEVSTVVQCRDCRDVRWMTAAADGTLYFYDSGSGALREVSTAGRIRTIASGLGRRSWTQPQVNERHRVMGLWTDAGGNVYAALYGSREVMRFSPDGRAQVVAKSRLPWSPTGGMVAQNGDLWILECSYTNAVRVRRIARDGKITVF